MSVTILVAGSNRNGNDRAKQKAIALFKEAGINALHTCQIYEDSETTREGDRAVDKAVDTCDIYYIVCSDEGYVGLATVLRLGRASLMPWVEVVSSQDLFDSDLHYCVDRVLSPEQLIASLREKQKLDGINL